MPDALPITNPADAQGTRPVPDPTLLTTEQLFRAIADLKELIVTRLNSAEKFTDKALDAETSLTAERFRSVATLMERAEKLRQEQKEDTKSAVDAALASQKEATTKMEASVSGSLSSLSANFTTSLNGVTTGISDIKERLTTLESIKLGQNEQRTEARQVSAGVIAAIGVGVSLLVAVLAVIGFFVATYGGTP